MDGRFVSDYHVGKIMNQRPLLLELEKKGFEASNKRILTIQSFGVPVTALVLILIDNLKSIKGFQIDLDKGIDKSLKSVDFGELPSELQIINHGVQIRKWDRGESKAVDTLVAASGSTAVGYSYWYYPSQADCTGNI